MSSDKHPNEDVQAVLEDAPAMETAMSALPMVDYAAPIEATPQQQFEALDKQIGRLQVIALDLAARHNLMPTTTEVRDVVLQHCNRAIAAPVKEMLDLAVTFSPHVPENYGEAARMVRYGIVELRRCIEDHNRQVTQMAEQYGEAVARLNDFMDYFEPVGGVSQVPCGPFARAAEDVTGVRSVRSIPGVG